MVFELALLLFPILMVIGGGHDAYDMTIPNWISGLLIVSFIALAFTVGMSLEQLGIHILIGFVMLVIGIILYSFGGFGGGDAKLIAAGALWMGWPAVVNFMLYLSLAGGVLTLFILFFRRVPLPEMVEKTEWIVRLHRVDVGIPYGIGIAAGGLLAYQHTTIFALLNS